MINDWPISSSVADLKQHIYELSLDTISPHFALAILGKRIDLEETKSLEEVGAMDGDILTIEPNREWRQKWIIFRAQRGDGGLSGEMVHTEIDWSFQG